MTGFAARYDLRYRAASFDFFTWMMHVRALGANEIVLCPKMPEHSSWSESEIRRRYESIVRPGPALAGMPCREGEDGENIGHHNIGRAAALLRPGWQRLRSPMPSASARYTVTLRKTKLRPNRDTNESLWREFAKRIGASVIEDYDVNPVHLHERMALYAGANMNFGVTNGPIAILFWTPYPVTMLDCQEDAHRLFKHGIEKLANWPFALPHQKLVWEKPTMDVLMREFKRVNDVRTAEHA